MAPGRITRSTNKSLPRKRYTDEVNDGYVDSNAQSTIPSSDNSDSDGGTAAAKGPSTAKQSPNRKRKQPATRATEKGKGAADSPVKKQQTVAQKSRAARKQIPQLLWSALRFEDSPEPELPDLPASTYAQSAIGEWVGFSDDIMHGQNEELQADDKPGESSKETEAHKSPTWSNSSTVEMLKATLAARQGPAGKDYAQLTRLGRGMSRRSRSGSIEWVDLGNRVPEGVEEEPPTLEQLRAQSGHRALRSGKMAQLAMEAIADGDQRPRDEAFEAWAGETLASEDENGEVLDDGPPIAAVRNDSDEDGEEAIDADGADETRAHQDEDPLEGETRPDQDGNIEEDGFDLDFEDDGEFKDMYDVGESSQGEGDVYSQRDEESLFVQDAQGSYGVGNMPQEGDSGNDKDHRSPEAESEEEDAEEEPQGEGIDDDEDSDDAGEDGQQEQLQTQVTRRTFASSEADQRRPSQTPLRRRNRSRQAVRFRPSEYIEATGDSYAASVQSQDLDKLLRCMKTRTWTNEGARWEAELLSGYNVQVSAVDLREINAERRKINRPPLSDHNYPTVRWYNAHRGELKIIKARETLQHVYYAWRICRDAPSAADLEAQADYFTNGVGKGLRKTLNSCENYIDYICTRLPNDKEDKVTWAESMRKSLSYRLIPLIVILLKEAFLMADTQPKGRNTRLDHVQELPTRVDATEFHLQTLLVIVGWLDRLCSVVISEFEHNAPDPHPVDWEVRMKQRRSVMRPLHCFAGALQKAAEDIGEAADEPARKAQAVENDRLMRELKEAQTQKDSEAREHQLQLFYASLQSTPRQSQQQMPFPATTYAFSQGLQQPPKRTRLSEKEQYMAENDGWSWDEDDTLMSALKRVDKPSASGLAESLSGRSAEQVKRRLMELREIGRRHYEKKRMAIPRWCQGYGWR